MEASVRDSTQLPRKRATRDCESVEGPSKASGGLDRGMFSSECHARPRTEWRTVWSARRVSD